MNDGIITCLGEHISAEQLTDMFEAAEREFAGAAFGDGQYNDSLPEVEAKLAALRQVQDRSKPDQLARTKREKQELLDNVRDWGRVRGYVPEAREPIDAP